MNWCIFKAVVFNVRSICGALGTRVAVLRCQHVPQDAVNFGEGQGVSGRMGLS